MLDGPKSSWASGFRLDRRLKGTGGILLASKYTTQNCSASMITYQELPNVRVTHEVWVVTQQLVWGVNPDSVAH